MINPKISVIITSYNDPREILLKCLRSVYFQNYENMNIIVVDDGSHIPVSDMIDFEYSDERLILKRIVHSERGVSRRKALEIVAEINAEYFIFLDSDMQLTEGFIEEIANEISRDPKQGYFVSEISFTEYKNFWSKVKVFERNLYTVDVNVNSKSNIEAARIWKMDDFPGFVEGLNSFEEIQPTIYAFKNNFKLGRFKKGHVKHDEKYVSLKGLLKKKTGYFKHMGENEKVNIKDVIQKFYFFRPQLYKKENLFKYFFRVDLFVGVLLLYTMLTVIGIIAIIGRRFSKCI